MKIKLLLGLVTISLAANAQLTVLDNGQTVLGTISGSTSSIGQDAPLTIFSHDSKSNDSDFKIFTNIII